MGVRVNMPVQVRNVCATECTCMSEHTTVSLQGSVHMVICKSACVCLCECVFRGYGRVCLCVGVCLHTQQYL